MGEAAQPQTRFGDYLDLLKVFNERAVKALVVGGQAVNFWAEFFEEEEPELQQWRPFTSADLDLHRPGLSAHQLLRTQAGEVEEERDPFGKAFTIVSHTFLIQGKHGSVLSVDSLKMVAGLRSEEVERSAVSVEFGGATIQVLNPIACLKAKLHNVTTIEQKGRQDEKHVRILIPCIRGFLRRLIREGQSSDNYRPALNGLEQLLLYTSRRKVIRTAGARGFDLIQTLPLAELATNQHPKLRNFVSKRLSKWQDLLRKIR